MIYKSQFKKIDRFMTVMTGFGVQGHIFQSFIALNESKTKTYICFIPSGYFPLTLQKGVNPIDLI